MKPSDHELKFVFPNGDIITFNIKELADALHSINPIHRAAFCGLVEYARKYGD